MSGRPSTASKDRLVGWRHRVVWLVPAADVAVLILGVIFLPRDPDPAIFVTLGAMIASFGFVGALVASRQSSNPIGWILWTTATLVAIALAGSDYAGYSAEHLGGALPGTVFIAWLASWLFVPAIGLTMVFVPLLFPNGHLPSRRWLPVAIFGTAAIAGGALVAFRSGPLQNVQAIQNPLGISGLRPLIDAVGFPPGSLMGLAILVALASAVVRFRSGGPVERRQLKWFGSVLFVAVLIFALAPDSLNLVSFASIGLLPLAIGIAVLRYRLYEIDRIISRTLAYTALTAALVVVYLAAFAAVQNGLAPFTASGGPLAVAASTLAVFALFQPLRRRFQSAMDRRFNRSRYDAQRTVEAFAGQLRDEVDIVRLGGEIEAVIGETLAPASVGVWLRPSGRR
jgi:hypothetical protein